MGSVYGGGLFGVVKVLSAVLAGLVVAPRLVVVTRNAQPLVEGDRANPVHADGCGGWGARWRWSIPRSGVGVIDVDESVPARVVARYVLAEVAASATVRIRSSTVPGRVMWLGWRPRVAGLPPSGGGLDPARSHLVIGATAVSGPHLITQLADMGAKTIVAVSRRPGDRLAGLTETLAARGVTGW